jgi:5-methylcytosine-specific restriction endonuclease McrA
MSPEIITRAEAIKNKQNKFFNGRACVHGHVSQRWTHNGVCVDCSNAASRRAAKENGYASKKRWNERNSDRLKAYRAEYRATNADKIKAQGIEYRTTNADKVKLRNAAYLAVNRKKANAAAAAWGKANRERVNETRAAWRHANPDKRRAEEHNRRARILGAEGFHTAAEVQELLQKQKCKCAICRVSIKNGYHKDHIQPLSRGGSNWAKNLQLTCPKCNLSKNDSDPITFMQSLGRLL